MLQMGPIAAPHQTAQAETLLQQHAVLTKDGHTTFNKFRTTLKHLAWTKRQPLLMPGAKSPFPNVR